MTERPRNRPEPKPEGGAQPTPELPPDQPKKLRGPILYLIIIIGTLLIFAPIAWAFITLIVVSAALSTTAKVVFWIIWGVCVIAFIWMVSAIWRRAS